MQTQIFTNIIKVIENRHRKLFHLVSRFEYFVYFCSLNAFCAFVLKYLTSVQEFKINIK